MTQIIVKLTVVYDDVSVSDARENIQEAMDMLQGIGSVTGTITYPATTEEL